MAGLLILHSQLLEFGVGAGLFGDGGLFGEALIKLIDEVLIVLKKLGDSHEGLDGADCRFVLLFPFVEEVLDVFVLFAFLNNVDKVLAVTVELGGGHCHFQYKSIIINFDLND